MHKGTATFFSSFKPEEFLSLALTKCRECLNTALIICVLLCSYNSMTFLNRDSLTVAC